MHGRSISKAAPLDPVHKAGERCLLHAEALCQFGHSLGAIRHNAQKPGLNGREVVALGDPRIEAVHQAGNLEKPGSRVGRRISGIVVSPVNHTPLSSGLFQGPGLCVVVHRAIVQSADS
jgi:hypothetical protein